MMVFSHVNLQHFSDMMDRQRKDMDQMALSKQAAQNFGLDPASETPATKAMRLMRALEPSTIVEIMKVEGERRGVDFLRELSRQTDRLADKIERETEEQS